MRPRSFERGKGLARAKLLQAIKASMRPRSFERGKDSAKGVITVGEYRFNEAALFRTRKVLAAAPEMLAMLQLQ